MKTYFIKYGYQCNLKPVQYQDTGEDAQIYQVDVYRYAADLISKLGLATVLDVGCGLGVKLKKFILPTGTAITGVGERDAIEFCKKQHKFGRWFVDDIENSYADLGSPFDFIICADVIEHLLDPDNLFSYFRRWSYPKTRILLSTPERDLRRGIDEMGPPGNRTHIRE